MKLKDFFGRNIEVNCNIELWLGTHDDNGELLEKAYGNENNLFEPWYGMEVVYITINKDTNGIILEVAQKQEFQQEDWKGNGEYYEL